MKWLADSNEKYNFRIIATFTEARYYGGDLQDEFDNFIDKIEIKYAVLECDNKETELQKEENYFEIKENKLDKSEAEEVDYFLRGENNFYFLALDEALYFFEKEYSNLQGSIANYPSEKKEKLFKRIGDIYLLKGDYRNAYFYYDLLFKLGVKEKNQYIKARAFQKMAMVAIFRMHYDKAENYAKSSYKIAKYIKNEYLIFKSYELIFWINEKGKYRTTIENIGYEKEFVRLAEIFGKKNRLAYFLTHTYNKISFRGPGDVSAELHEKGHEIACDIKNENCILSAHLKTALVYAVNGLYEVSQSYYKKIENKLIELYDEFKLAQTYNGMGYYCLVRGQYKKADEYYDKALENLKSNWNFDEICMTLINKSINAIMADDYMSAEKNLETLLAVIKKLNFSRLRLISLTKVYGIMALNNFYLGNYYRCYSFLSKIQIIRKNEKFYEDDEEYFLKSFTQGLMFKNRGYLEAAEKCFESARDYIDKMKGSLKCFYPKFILEYYNLLIHHKKQEKAQEIKNAGYIYCCENKIDIYKDLFDGECIEKISLESSLSKNYWIVEAAKQQSSITLLNDKMDEINFINSFQEILTTTNDKNTMVNESITFLENKFGIDYTLLIFKDEDKMSVMYSRNSIPIDEECLKEFDSIFKDYSNPFISLECDDSRINEFIKKITGYEVRSFIYVPVIKEEKCIVSFLGMTKIDDDIVNGKIVLDKSDLRIMNIAVRQLSESIQKIKWQERLIESVSTDMLTKLYNRQYFYEKISSLLDECRKYNINEEISLFYLDLDNFKFYNDTFGHTVGDKVLILFADILKSFADEKTIAVRFGGDEFILMSKSCTLNIAKENAESIYRKLNERNGFKKEIEEILNEKITIPESRILGCSIGISHNVLNKNFNINKFIDEADTALYEAKRNGKGKYKIYNYQL